MKQLLLTLLTIVITLQVYAQPGRSHVENALQDKYMKKYGEPGMNKFNKFAMGKIEAEYEFPQVVHMHFVEYKNGKKKDETDVVFHVNTKQQIFGYSGSDVNNGEAATIIIDEKNGTMVMLNEKDKTAFAMNTKNMGMQNMSKMYQNKVNNSEVYEDVKCSKSTGNRTIANLSCVKYHCVDEEEGTSADIWVTDKKPMSFEKAGSMTPWTMYLNGVGGVEGTMMAGKFYKKDKLDNEFEVTKLETDSDYTVKTSEYKQMDMFGR